MPWHKRSIMDREVGGSYTFLTIVHTCTFFLSLVLHARSYCPEGVINKLLSGDPSRHYPLSYFKSNPINSTYSDKLSWQCYTRKLLSTKFHMNSSLSQVQNPFQSLTNCFGTFFMFMWMHVYNEFFLLFMKFTEMPIHLF